MPSVKVALDNLADDAEVEIPYLGKFKNNSTTEVDQVKWDRYVTLQPGADQLEGQDTLEVSTAQAAEQTEARAEAAETVEQTEDLNNLKKSKLVDLATALGIENPDQYNKDELIPLIEQGRAVSPGQQ